MRPLIRASKNGVAAALVGLSEGNQIYVERDHPRFRNSLIYAAAERTGMAGHLYKLNTILPAPECRTRVVAVLERYLAALQGDA